MAFHRTSHNPEVAADGGAASAVNAVSPTGVGAGPGADFAQ
jgi:hypothetical protein